MADVRALLKAKRQDVKISHPLASYGSTGQLRCIACGTAVKHASAWEGHLGSKIHRTNVARLKEEDQKREVQRQRDEAEAAARAAREAQVVQGKRKAEDEDMEDEDDDESQESDTKRRKVGDDRPSGFPSDFFSDPTRAMPVVDDDSDEESAPQPANTPAASAQKSAIDLEYERFQRELNMEPQKQETYERATVFAEAVMTEVNEGLPPQDAGNGQPVEPDELDEEAKRQKKEQEERELIMDRLLDEESQQEEADMRVAAMKARVEALKKKREAKRAKPSS